MRSASTTVCPPSAVPSTVSLREAISVRLADYAVLLKPRIAVLALITVSAGFTLSSTDGVRLPALAHALFGIALVAAASNSLNQLLERHTDARMRRTENRPLPTGRISPWEVFVFGLATGVGGVAYLALCVNLLTAALAALTLFLYVGVYTPLKRRTSLCTALGAIPGALPPVLGWTAAGGQLDAGAFSLFSVLFLWQFPHFLAIAWLYREDYAHAGLKMLPLGGHAPRVVGILAAGYSLVLLPLSLAPSACGLAGRGYAAAAIVLGLGYVVAAMRFAACESVLTARSLLATSLVYLPVLLAALVWDNWRLLT